MDKSETSLGELEKLRGKSELEVITLAGGCFWCIESAIQTMSGVEAAINGYTGGDIVNPSYEDVVGGNTGHREAVQVYFDPNKVSLKEILDRFWSYIDPTDDGGQFADRGFQYTTAVYYRTPEQKEIIEKSKEFEQSKDIYKGKEVVTEILPFTNFYEAEDYHQDYFLKASERYKRYEKGSGRKDYVDKKKK